MSLKKLDLWAVVRAQYIYKLKGFPVGWIVGLILLQVIGLLFTLSNGAMSVGASGLQIKSYSANVVIAFTMVWVLATAVNLSRRPWLGMDFTLVTNRLSAHLSNLAFLITVCLFAAVTATLSGALIRIILYSFFHRPDFLPQGFYIAPAVFLTGIVTAFFYMLMMGALGYFFGQWARIHAVFAVILPLLLVKVLSTNTTTVTVNTSSSLAVTAPLSMNLIDFFANEKDPRLFFLKALLTAGVLFALGILPTLRLEVRR